ncbi:uncharacterized protein [Primulina eburnea]|uniref:uncharacterized protein isoform X2 n=1 Tax=Primulina eburnea TaxID=1245227 RepID=UPI003C6C2B0C
MLLHHPYTHVATCVFMLFIFCFRNYVCFFCLICIVYFVSTSMEVFVGCITRFSVLFTTKISAKKKMVAYTAYVIIQVVWHFLAAILHILAGINFMDSQKSTLVLSFPWSTSKGTLESKCSEPEDFYVVSSKSASPVTQNWGDIYGVPWLLLVLSSLYWINQRWEYVRVCPSELGFLFMLFQLTFHGEL